MSGLREYNAKRDFAKTPEPPGDGEAAPQGAKGRARSFVIQKHAASHLHYDFRLELEGVLKSWSVPKGPNLDPEVKRLAMATEDHPLGYATFEGIIPKGQYGGGTVMVWDRGTWTPLDDDPHKAYRAGHLRFTLDGAKLHGGWTLQRTDERRWLLIKVRDAHASTEDVTQDLPDSAVSGRSLEAIAADADRVWHSNRAPTPGADGPPAEGARRAKMPRTLRVEEAARGQTVPRGAGWLHEMAIDGERVVAFLDGGTVVLRSGRREVTYGAVSKELAQLTGTTAVIDGVVTAVLPDGRPSSEALEALTHSPVYYAFDLLHVGGWDLSGVPLAARKEALHQLLGSGRGGAVRFCVHVAGNGPAYLTTACRLGLPAIVSKRADALHTGGPSDAWRKVTCPAGGDADDVPVERAPGPGKTESAAKPASTATSAKAAKRANAAKAGNIEESDEVLGVRISNPARVVFPDLGTTKLELARFYADIADHAVPHLAGRPLTLVRGDAGAGGPRAFMRHAKAWGPDVLRRVRIQEKTKVGAYLVADTPEALVALVQMNVLEIHTWNTTDDDVERPNRLVLDLDPDLKTPWPRVVATAQLLRQRLDDAGLRSFVKTTGGKGLHVVSPLVPRADWSECLQFARDLATRVARESPGELTLEMAKERRRGRMLIDYLRNNRTNTSVAAFSTRARPDAPMSVTLRWDELEKPTLRSDTFTLANLRARLTRQKRDPWAEYATSARPLPMRR